MSYLYWAVACKTLGCDTQIAVKYVGVFDSKKFPLLIGMKPNPLQVTCHKCEGSYDYVEPELVPIISEQGPSSEFLNMF